MIEISVNNIAKSFEVGAEVLSGLSFLLHTGEHVGILGANGSGKTTLFRILTGEITADSGEYHIAEGRRLGLVSQLPVFDDDLSTEDVLKEAQRSITDTAAELAALEKTMATDFSRQVREKYDRLSENFRLRGGYNLDFERNRIANGLDITAEMREAKFSLLSGGERTRVNLARLFLEDADILLLDEPTNHLDLKATQWLSEYLAGYKGSVLLISHDRYFLGTAVHRCIEIEDGKAELYSGNYSFYLEERRRRCEEKLLKYEKDSEKLEQLTQAAERMHLWANMGGTRKMHSRAASIDKRIERLGTPVKPKTARQLKVSFKEREFSGDEVLFIEDLEKGYGGKKLFKIPQALVRGGERIAIIGANGSGKTSLIKILMGEEKQDNGHFKFGNQIKPAYLPQIIKFTDENRTATETLIYDSRASYQEARDSLAAFGFAGEDAEKCVSDLSGGEQSRLRLCMLMRSDINLLILDEPTNHLDLASREWIEDCLENYGETLIFVSHDRYFIEKFASRIWSIEDGEFTDYIGTYAEYLAYKKQLEYVEKAKKAKNTEKTGKNRRDKNEKPGKKKSPNIKKQKEKTEEQIKSIEEQIELLCEKAVTYGSDYIKLMEIEEEKDVLENKLINLYEQWEELYEALQGC